MIRQPLIGIPIREKKIKGRFYQYQVVKAWRDKETGQVRKIERYLGPRKPARPEPMMDLMDKTDLAIITAAWKRGEGIDWVQTYLTTAIGEKPAPDTVYKWLRAHGIRRDPKGVKITAASVAKIARAKGLKVEDAERKAAQARLRREMRG